MGVREEGFEVVGVGDGFVAEVSHEPAVGGGEVEGGGAGVGAGARGARGLAGFEAGGEAGEAGGGAGEAGPERQDEAGAARIAQEGAGDEGGEAGEDEGQARGEGDGARNGGVARVAGGAPFMNSFPFVWWGRFKGILGGRPCLFQSAPWWGKFLPTCDR